MADPFGGHPQRGRLVSGYETCVSQLQSLRGMGGRDRRPGSGDWEVFN